MLNQITQITKRNGLVVDFEPEKVTEAIYKAAKEVACSEGTEADKNQAIELTNSVITILKFKHGEDDLPSVEDIQDTVEKVLIKYGHAKTAKAFIIYRYQHEKMREIMQITV